MSGEVEMRRERLEAVCRLIERPPVDDVQLDASVATNLAADVRAVLEELDRRAPPPGREEERLRIARIVDPEMWSRRERFLAAGQIKDADGCVAIALAKADAIMGEG